MPASLGRRAQLAFATLGPLGRMPAPGTWGSLAGLLVAPYLFLPLPTLGRVPVLLALFFLGGLAAKRAEEEQACKDPSCVIIDEVLGQWVALAPFAAASGTRLALAFLLFRLFDIWKPWPVCWSETCLPHGFGIMIDDVVAGLYAALALVAIGWLWGSF